MRYEITAVARDLCAAASWALAARLHELGRRLVEHASAVLHLPDTADLRYIDVDGPTAPDG